MVTIYCNVRAGTSEATIINEYNRVR